MIKHTPGPWIVERDEDSKRAQTIIRRADGMSVAKLVRQGLPTDEPNAKLIAAAPALADALEALLAERAAPTDERWGDAIRALRAAGRIP